MPTKKLHLRFHSPPVQTLLENLRDIYRLQEIHEQLTGTSVGYKHGVEVLHKSGIVLLVACWEAYVEDLTALAFDVLLSNATAASTFPKRVLVRISKTVRESPDDMAPWTLADAGWRNVVTKYKNDIFERFIGRLNTPKPAQVNELFEAVIGISNITSCWHWKGMSATASQEKLTRLVKLRGEIAHRVGASTPVHKENVYDHLEFIQRLAAKTHNVVRRHILDITSQQRLTIAGKEWDTVSYRSVA